MHEAQSVIATLGLASRAAIRAQSQLTAQGASRLRTALENDAKGYIRHAALALSHGICAANSGHSTWAIVAFYYSVFYSARAWLGLNQHVIFYANSSPCSLEVRAGAFAAQLKGPTHQVVLEQFTAKNPNSYFLSQEIDQMSPLDWLREMREIANYKNSAPFEPLVFECFSAPIKAGIRRALVQYLDDSQGLFMFDRDHAMIAFPLCFFNDTQKAFRGSVDSLFDEPFQRSLSALLKDKNGILAPMINILSDE